MHPNLPRQRKWRVGFFLENAQIIRGWLWRFLKGVMTTITKTGFGIFIVLRSLVLWLVSRWNAKFFIIINEDERTVTARYLCIVNFVHAMGRSLRCEMPHQQCHGRLYHSSSRWSRRSYLEFHLWLFVCNLHQKLHQKRLREWVWWVSAAKST